MSADTMDAIEQTQVDEPIVILSDEQMLADLRARAERAGEDALAAAADLERERQAHTAHGADCYEAGEPIPSTSAKVDAARDKLAFIQLAHSRLTAQAEAARIHLEAEQIGALQDECAILVAERDRRMEAAKQLVIVALSELYHWGVGRDELLLFGERATYLAGPTQAPQEGYRRFEQLRARASRISASAPNAVVPPYTLKADCGHAPCVTNAGRQALECLAGKA